MKEVRSILLLSFVSFFFTVGPAPLVEPLAADTHYDLVSVQEIPLAENRSDRTIHGYVEYRFRITNRDKKSHQVGLTLPNRSDSSPGRTSLVRCDGAVEVPPESSVILKMLQPPIVIGGATNEVRVTIDGRVQQDTTPFFKNSYHLESHSSRAGEIAHVFVSQQVPADMHNLMRVGVIPGGGASTGTVPPGTPSPAGAVPAGGGAELVVWLASIPVEEWSDSWLAYTRFDSVALTNSEWKDLESRRPAVLDALRRYTEAGGMLTIVGKDWNAPKEWAPLPGASRYYAVFGLVEVLDKEMNAVKPEINAYRDRVLDQSRSWKTAMGDMSRGYGSGGGYSFLGGSSHLFSSDTPLLQSMPVLSNYGVSVKLIMVLIVVFAILIGPVNIYVLSLIKRRIWLLWTVPVTSLIASILVLGASFFQEGFLRQCSSITYSVLDQRHGEATTVGFVGYYSTLTPRGILFSPETEVTACINRSFGDSHHLELDLRSGGNQFFTRGWIHARVPAYFAIRKTESQRKERIVFDWTGQTPTATNGLGADIESLSVRSPAGVLYAASLVRAGEKVELEKKSEVRDEGTGLYKLNTVYNRIISAGPTGSFMDEVDLPSGGYLAILNEWNPLVEPGIDRMKPFENRTTIFGLY